MILAIFYGVVDASSLENRLSVYGLLSIGVESVDHRHDRL